LDATKEYTENLVDYVMTMVGVAVKGQPIIGVLHRPFQVDTYWAVVGHGNSENLNKVHDKHEPPLGDKEVRIIVSRSHAGNVKNFTKHVLGPNDHVQIISAAGAGIISLLIMPGLKKYIYFICRLQGFGSDGKQGRCICTCYSHKEVGPLCRICHT
jgi:inositol monophosphatase 3